MARPYDAVRLWDCFGEASFLTGDKFRGEPDSADAINDHDRIAGTNPLIWNLRYYCRDATRHRFGLWECGINSPTRRPQFKVMQEIWNKPYESICSKALFLEEFRHITECRVKQADLMTILKKHIQRNDSFRVRQLPDAIGMETPCADRPRPAVFLPSLPRQDSSQSGCSFPISRKPRARGSEVDADSVGGEWVLDTSFHLSPFWRWEFIPVENQSALRWRRVRRSGLSIISRNPNAIKGPNCQMLNVENKRDFG